MAHCQGERQVEGEEQSQEADDGQDEPALPAVQAGEASRAGDELDGVEIGAVGEGGGAAIEGDGPGEPENGERGQRKDNQLSGAEEGLAGEQVPGAAPGPRRIGGGAELTAETAGEDRAPAVHPHQQQCQNHGFAADRGIGGVGIVDVVPEQQQGEGEGRGAQKMADQGCARRAAKQVDRLFEQRDGAGSYPHV